MINILRSNCTEIGNTILCFHSYRVELLNRNIMWATLESLNFPISHLLIGLPSLSPTIFFKSVKKEQVKVSKCFI